MKTGRLPSRISQSDAQTRKMTRSDDIELEAVFVTCAKGYIMSLKSSTAFEICFYYLVPSGKLLCDNRAKLGLHIFLQYSRLSPLTFLGVLCHMYRPN